MKIVTAAEMINIDRVTIEEIGLPACVLMERAGVAVARHVRERFAPTDVVVLCGGGNNGGDGIVAARELYNDGFSVRVFLLIDPAAMSSDSRQQYEIARRLGIDIAYRPVLKESDLNCTLIIDAIMGTGLKSNVKEAITDVISLLNSQERDVFAVDIPSGISADTAAIMGSAVRARWTVTFGLPKRGHVQYPGKGYTGELIVENIGFPQALLNSETIKCDLIDKEFMSALVPLRPPDSYKGSFGHVLIVGGSLGKTGSVLMAGRAALRTGSGLVTIGVPETLMDVYQTKVFEEMTLPCASNSKKGFSREALPQILEFVEKKCDCLAVGPGMGVDDDTVEIVRGLIERSPVPVIIDADAINSLASLGYTQRLGVLNTSRSPVILTPHAGEMARLLSEGQRDFTAMIVDIESDKINCASRFATASTAYVVYKGAPTVTADPEGKTFVNPSGTAAMAKAGSGDVLTGIIASFAGQGLPPLYATLLGVYVHGLAGELAAEKSGMHSTLASEIIDSISQALSLLMGL
ncbi:MAG: NAD(P)H-hydrate dehydratase [Nitrospirae bacterium]|nr:NAD(P)H-hydrate dehydratase [Nitrospirota bacterium]MBF0591386.1 NAD(P)H-hydrate dehydratase [Nitrospirota bacterium]